MNNIQLNTKELVAVSKIITLDKRVYLNNVYVTKDFICASDGIHLGKILCDTGVTEPILIPLDTIKMWTKMVPKRFHENPVIINHISDNTYSLNSGEISLPFNSADGQYPDINKVIPTEFEDSNVENKNFQWQIVGKLAAIFTELTGNSFPRPFFSKDVGIIAFMDERIMLILMPMNN